MLYLYFTPKVESKVIVLLNLEVGVGIESLYISYTESNEVKGLRSVNWHPVHQAKVKQI